MPTYRFSWLDKAGAVRGRDFICFDDVEALTLAGAMMRGGADPEVWDGARLVRGNRARSWQTAGGTAYLAGKPNKLKLRK